MDTLATGVTDTLSNAEHDSPESGNAGTSGPRTITPLEEPNAEQHNIPERDAHEDDVPLSSIQDEDIVSSNQSQEVIIRTHEDAEKYRTYRDEDSESAGESHPRRFYSKQAPRIFEEWHRASNAAESDYSNKEPNFPKVLWRVDVYRRGRSPREPDQLTATFKNDRPYDLSRCWREPTATKQSSKRPGSDHKGISVIDTDLPVFELQTRILQHDNTIRGKHGTQARTPRSFDDLQIEKSAKMRMIIISETLRNTLRSIVSYYPALPSLDTPSIVPEPYALLMHHFSAIEQFADDGRGEEELKEIKDIDASATAEQSTTAV